MCGSPISLHMASNQTSKNTFLSTIVPVAAMIAVIVILTRMGLSATVAIGGPVLAMVLFGVIKQAVDNKKAKAFFANGLSLQNRSRIKTAGQLNMTLIDGQELFSNDTELPFGEHTVTFQHERVVMTRPILTEITGIPVSTLKGQELQVGWHYINDDPNKIGLTFQYAPLS